eukprot:1193965-Prorocentrum_minimum.AAC.2
MGVAATVAEAPSQLKVTAHLNTAIVAAWGPPGLLDSSSHVHCVVLVLASVVDTLVAHLLSVL